MNKKQIKRTLLSLMLLLVLPCSAWAGKHVIFTTPEEYQLFRISPNGKWGCGMYVDYSNNTYAFRWNLVSGKIELLSTSEQSEAWSISDNGVVAGACTVAYGGKAARSLPALYYEGAWHVLELPNENIAQGLAYDITPDGQYAVASVTGGDTGPYEAYIWKNGKVHRQLSDFGGGCPMPYCISPDGQTAGGWKHNKNRQACLWNADGTATVLSDYESPWSCARRFSPDGKKVVIWGGWNDEGLMALYDMETGQKTRIMPLDWDYSFEFFDLDNQGHLVGEHGGRACIYENGTLGFLDAWLEAKGVDLNALDPYVQEGTDYYQIIRGQNLSADGSVIGLIYLANSTGNTAAMRSAVIKLDFDAKDILPASLQATQLDGTCTARITWDAPAGAEGIQGYHIYRDGIKVATTEAGAVSYHDKNLQPGTYSYQVSIAYADGESRLTEPVKVEIQELRLQMAQALASRQKGLYNAFLSWAQPKSNLVTKTYTDITTAQIQGFGASNENFPFEVAIRVDGDEVQAYEGYRLTKVNFYPLSANKDWKVNVYTYEADGTLSLLVSQSITQTLEYGKMNTVVLDKPLDLPKGDLLVAIGVTIETPNLNVLGMDYGRAKPRYSDLLRAVGEADFYSLEEMSQANGYMSSASWMMEAILSKEGDADDVDVIDGYKVYADGTLVQTTTDLHAVIPALAEGDHTLGVSVVYAGGKESDVATTTRSIKLNAKALAAVKGIQVGMAENRRDLTATWHRPVDVDPTYMSYAGETPSEISVNVPDGYNMIQFAHDYPSSMLKSYEGYRITSCRFYPLTDATYTFLVYENGKLVAEQGVEAVETGKWNSVAMETPVEIKSGATYRLVIDCYDVEPGKEVVAMDRNVCYAGLADLYSLDGESYQPISSNAGISHNVMLGFNMEDAQGMALPVVGYDVLLEGQKANGETLRNARFEYTFDQEQVDGDKPHTIAVDAWYELVAESVKGAAENYTVAEATGIRDNQMANLTIRQNHATLTLVGEGIQHVCLIAMDGTEVAASDVPVLSIGHLSAGIYLVKVETKGGTLVRKIRIS